MVKFLLSVVIRAQIIFHNLKSVDIVKKNVREISLQRIAFQSSENPNDPDSEGNQLTCGAEIVDSDM
jgi:hypothetical protein